MLGSLITDDFVSLAYTIFTLLIKLLYFLLTCPAKEEKPDANEAIRNRVKILIKLPYTPQYTASAWRSIFFFIRSTVGLFGIIGVCNELEEQGRSDQ